MANSSNVAAMNLEIQSGRQLQRLHPDIVESYRDGNSLAETAQSFDVCQLFNLRPAQDKIAGLIVYRALIGNGNKDYGPVYSGLLGYEEAREIGEQHLKAGRILGGTNARDNQSGIFDLSPEEKSANSVKAGRAGGSRVATLGIGYCTHDLSVRKERGDLSALKRGQLPWGDEELILASLIFQYSGYQDDYGRRNLDLGVNALNDLYHEGKEIRTILALRSALSRKRKKIQQFILEDVLTVKDKFLD